jgi:hypothetical protein
MDAAAYVANEMAQVAVEREFEIIGEALNQLAKLSGALAARIPDLPQIVAFRKQLIHGYATVNVGTVWNVLLSDAKRSAATVGCGAGATGRTRAAIGLQGVCSRTLRLPVAIVLVAACSYSTGAGYRHF